MNDLVAARARWQAAPNMLAPLTEQLQTLVDSRQRASAERLAVGLFGGTGVGKSSLVNAIVGQDVAKASATRPTSREVAVYAPQGADLEPTLRARFGDDFSYQEIDSELSNLVLIDTPDIDSVVGEHAMIANQWLPSLDLAILITSPERYLDQKPTLSLTRQAKTTPVALVFNKADTAEPETIDAWKAQLKADGLDQYPQFVLSAKTGDIAPLKQYLVSLGVQGGDDLLRIREAQLDASILSCVEQCDLVEASQKKTQAAVQSVRKLWAEHSEVAVVARRFATALASNAPEDPAPIWWRWLRPNPPSAVRPDATDLDSICAEYNQLSAQFLEGVGDWHSMPVDAVSKPCDPEQAVGRDRLRQKLAKAISVGSGLAALAVGGLTIWRLVQAVLSGHTFGLAAIIDALMLIVLIVVLGRGLYWVCLPTPYTRAKNAQLKQVDDWLNAAQQQLSELSETCAQARNEASQWLKDEAKFWQAGSASSRDH